MDLDFVLIASKWLLIIGIFIAADRLERFQGKGKKKHVPQKKQRTLPTESDVLSGQLSAARLWPAAATLRILQKGILAQPCLEMQPETELRPFPHAKQVLSRRSAAPPYKQDVV